MMDYACHAWRSAGRFHIRRLQALKSKCLRLKTGAPWYVSNRQIHEDQATIMCHADDKWTEALPLVLLGIRTAYMEDLQSSAAELVYGEHLRVPGELLVPAAPKVETSAFIQQLRRHIDQLRPTPTARHASPTTFIHKDLEDSTHLFLRQDVI